MRVRAMHPRLVEVGGLEAQLLDDLAGGALVEVLLLLLRPAGELPLARVGDARAALHHQEPLFAGGRVDVAKHQASRAVLAPWPRAAVRSAGPAVAARPTSTGGQH